MQAILKLALKCIVQFSIVKTQWVSSTILLLNIIFQHFKV